MDTPQIGQIYRHYKQDSDKGDYKIVAIGYDTETKEEVVIYKPLYTPEHLSKTKASVYVRPVSVFCETVEFQGEMVPRFSLME